MMQETKATAPWQPRGLDGVGGGREIREEGDRCIPMSDSCWYKAETTIIYKVIILQLKIKIF